MWIKRINDAILSLPGQELFSIFPISSLIYLIDYSVILGYARRINQLEPSNVVLH